MKYKVRFEEESAAYWDDHEAESHADAAVAFGLNNLCDGDTGSVVVKGEDGVPRKYEIAAVLVIEVEEVK